MNIFDDVVHVVNNPVIAWKVISNYWIGYLLNYGPRYQEYLRTEESKGIDSNFYDDPLNDIINQIPGYEKPLTPKQKFEQLTEYYSYCYEKNQQCLALLPLNERQYVAAMSPVDAAGFRRNRDPREPNMDDIDKNVELGKFRASYANKIKEMRRKKAQRFHHSVEDSSDFVIAEIMNAVQFSKDQCGAQITDGDLGAAWLKGDKYVEFIDEQAMSDAISDDAKQRIMNKMYALYEAKAAFLFDAKEHQPELMADHMFAEDDMLLLQDFATNVDEY